MRRIEPELASGWPDTLVVVGDVNSTLASALVAAKLGLPVAHVEAGLRSFDRSMPEEVNRVVTDVLSDYLFVSEPSGVENLRAEGVPEERVFLVGNVMIDTLLRFRERAANSDVHQRLGLEPHQYAVATLHRPSNVDDAARLNSLMQALREVATRLPVVVSRASAHEEGDRARGDRHQWTDGLPAAGLFGLPSPAKPGARGGYRLRWHSRRDGPCSACRVSPCATTPSGPSRSQKVPIA